MSKEQLLEYKKINAPTLTTVETNIARIKKQEMIKQETFINWKQTFPWRGKFSMAFYKKTYYGIQEETNHTKRIS